MLEPKILCDDNKKIEALDDYRANYSFKLSPEYHEKIKNIFKCFRGSKNYHNYTKKVAFKEPQSKRHIYEFTCDELINFEIANYDPVIGDLNYKFVQASRTKNL